MSAGGPLPAVQPADIGFGRMTDRSDVSAERAYRQMRSKLPCVAADWAGGSDRLTAIVLLVFGLALLAVTLSWVV